MRRLWKSGKDAKEMKAVDLFCGCGGTLAGLRDAGYAAMLGLDWDEDALRVCQMNGL